MNFLYFALDRLSDLFSNVAWLIASFFWKRDNSIVVFGAWFGQRFADTSRFLFQYLSDNKDELKLKHVIWVTRSDTVYEEVKNMGYEVYYLESKESAFYHKIAGYHIICNFSNDIKDQKNDISCRYSFGAKRINLWHGVMPMKGVACASRDYEMKKEKHKSAMNISEFIYTHSKIYRTLFYSIGGWGNCYYLSTTRAGTDVMRKFFILPPCYYIETGNPRVSYIPKLTPKELELIQYIKKKRFVVLYLPTFRDNENVNFEFIKAYQSLLSQNDILWIQKFHSAAKNANNNRADYNDNINCLPSEFDINIIMPFIDLLITDYSSVAADAVYFEKPIFYYMPDYDIYMKNDRGFVIDPQDVMCGPQFYDPNDLIEEIIKKSSNNPPFEPDENYVLLKNKYWGERKTMDEVWHDIQAAMC